jgi:t-SNARE complex subunit (syntaxin)
MLKRSFASACLGLFALAFTATAAFGQMPRPDTTNLLSSSDVSQQQIQKAARIATSLQSSMRAEQMKLRKEMKQKYGNPQEMDSTQKATARREMRKRQMAMRKKQMKMMQQQAQQENMSPKMFQRIMRSAQQDSTLKKQIQQAMRAQMKSQSPMGGGGQ